MEASDRRKRRRSLRLRRQSVGRLDDDLPCIEADPAPLDPSLGSIWRESPKSEAFAEKRRRRRSSRIHLLPILASTVENENSESPEKLRTRDASPDRMFKSDSPPSCFNCPRQSPSDNNNSEFSIQNDFQLNTPEFEPIKTPDMNIEMTQTPTSKKDLDRTPKLDKEVCVNESFVTRRNSKHSKIDDDKERSHSEFLVNSPLFRKDSPIFTEAVPYSPSQPMNFLGSPFPSGSHDTSICQDSPEKCLEYSESPTGEYLLKSEFHTPQRKGVESEKLPMVENVKTNKNEEYKHLSENKEYSVHNQNLSETGNCLDQCNRNSQPSRSLSDNTDLNNCVLNGQGYKEDPISDVKEQIWTLKDIEKEFSVDIQTYANNDLKQNIGFSGDEKSSTICEEVVGKVEDYNNYMETQMSSSSSSVGEASSDSELLANCRRSTRVRRKSLESFQATLNNYENSKNRKKSKHLLMLEQLPIEDIYLNKNFVRPDVKTWETIFEMPIKGKAVSLRKFRRSILFETITPTRLKQRQKRVKRLGVRKRKPLNDEFVHKKIASLDEELMSE